MLSETKRLVARLESGELKAAPGVPEIALGGSLSAWLLAGDRADAASLPARVRALSAGPHRIYKGDQVFHVVVAPTSLGRLIVQYDATLNEELVHEFGVQLLIIGALCIGLGIVLANMLARLVVAPLKRLTQRLARWAPGGSQLSAPNDDEEATLLAAFDRVRSGLEEAAARQREFAANIAHELRTPLSAARTDIELAALSPHVSPMTSAPDQGNGDDRCGCQHARIAACIVFEQAGKWSASTCTHWSTTHGGACAGTAKRRRCGWLTKCRSANPSRRPARAADDCAQSAAQRCRACRARNVRRATHGERLTFTDDGPGIAAADLPFVFERYYRGR